MLIEFKNLLVANGYYHMSTIGALTSSCCTTNTNAILDFDKIKDDFFSALHVTTKPKSVDAILLTATQREIYFIEMTSFKKYATASGSASYDALLNFIDKDMGGFGLPNKIIDSINVILGMAGRYNINPVFYPYFFDRNRLKIKTIFVTDCNDRMSLLLRRSNAHKRQISLTKRIEGEIDIMNCTTLDTTLTLIPSL